jgi:hypothetical protein
MLNEFTVFILGAGASMPYDYPSGRRLVDIICANLQTHRDIVSTLQRMDHKHETILEFRSQLRLAATPSADAFLEHRPEFIDIGKAVIAHALIICENESILFQKDDWYRYLFENLNAPFEEFSRNKIAIITFNYDRSLEHFLFTALQNKYGKRPEECAQVLKEMKIVHLHGQLDDLPWQNENGRAYGWKKELSHTSLQKAARGIRIISEDFDLESDPKFKMAYQWLNDAKRVYFLGFGYHETNVKRLLRHRINPYTFEGTAYDLEDAQKNRIEIIFRETDNEITLRGKEEDILKFLKRYVLFV